jgi:hypothetical protein
VTPTGRRRAAGWTALAAGLGASAAAVVLAVQAAHPVADAGELPVTAPTSSPATVATTPAATTATQPPTAAPVTGWAPPTQLGIGALGVTAAVDAVGVTAGGALAVPGDPARVGWWIGSALPGSAHGTVLLAGHVDTASQGPGALFRLERMPLGTTIAVRADGQTVTYRAVARRSYDKQHLPADLFQPGTAPRLALVTCGGTFHDGTYSHNVVIYAVPVA